MAQLPSIFQADQHESSGFDPIPAGKYVAIITNSEMVETKNPGQSGNKGKYLKLQLKIVGEGEGKGRVVFVNLNLINDNETAVTIANQQLAAICKAVGVGQVTDSQVLHDKPMEIKVTVKAETSEFPASNEVKGFQACGEGVAVGSTPVGGAAPVVGGEDPPGGPAGAPPAAKAGMPWGLT